jgi:hypothetical protein
MDSQACHGNATAAAKADDDFDQIARQIEKGDEL